MVDQFSYKDLDSVRAFVRHRAYSRLDHIRHHADPRLTRLRTRSRITVILLAHIVLLRYGALIKKLDSARTMVCYNKIHDILWQMVFFCDFKPVTFVRF